MGTKTRRLAAWLRSQVSQRGGAASRQIRSFKAFAPAVERASRAVSLLKGEAHEHRPGEMAMPSPWAAAVALLTLLAFGVWVGTVISPAQQSAGASVLLAASPHGATSTTPATTGQSQTPSSPPQTSSESTPETTQETTTTTTTTQAKKPPSSSKLPQGGGEPSVPSAGLPSIQHVFLIVLSDVGESATFAAGSAAPFLSHTLRTQGELIQSYYAVAGGELANEIALISGQGPTPQTAQDCPLYSDLAGAASGKLGQVVGNGCIYPSTTLTVADQLTSAGKTWRAYVEDMGKGTASQSQTCQHPAVGAADGDSVPTAASAYVTWRNPFVYFHSLIDTRACATSDVGFAQLASDLKAAANTPSLAYIVPNRCHDGSPQPCAPGQPAGLSAADAFLRKAVPEIESSPAYKQGGLIAITSDQAPQSGAQADSSGCCVSTPYPNLPASGAPAGTPSPGAGAQTSAGAGSGSAGSGSGSASASAGPAGGGKVGLLLISKYVKPGSLNTVGEYDHFSLLRTIENLFGLQPLGYAGEPALLAFDKSVFNASH